MKESIDDLTNQAIDMVLKNNALQERIVEPLRKKIVPYAICAIVFNILLFVLLVYLVRKVSHLPLSHS